MTTAFPFQLKLSSLLLMGVISMLAITMPYMVQAETIAETCPDSSQEDVAIINIQVTSLTTSSHKPTISGSACGTSSIRVTLKKEGISKTFFKSKVIKVKKDGTWKTKITKTLKDGVYEISVSGTKGTARKALAEGTITIGKNIKGSTKSSTILAVDSIPLLFGGMARGGTSVPIAYLQITNIGKETITLKGFSLRQNGSAPGTAIIGLTTVDDLGGSRGYTGGVEGATPFKNNVAFVPTEIVQFAPDQMRLFTIKAALTQNMTPYIGKQLSIDVIGVETNGTLQNVFPIRGTVWTLAI